MRKQTKIAALVSAAALLAIGASMTSFAAWDHDPDTGEYIYLDSDGERVYGEWKKDGANWYYLDDETGLMKRSSLVPYDSSSVLGDGNYYYYVDENGARVVNQWVYLSNDDEIAVYNDYTPSGIWYRFGANGRSVSGQQNINGAYYRFNEDCQMIAGWYDLLNSDGTVKDTYYYNDTVAETDSTYGQALVGWYQLPIPADEYDPTGSGEYDELDDSIGYYYFSSTGARYTGDRYFNKAWWHFNEYGVLKTGWQTTSTPSVAKSNDPANYNIDSGKLKSSWIYVSDANVYEAGSSGNGTYWFYVDAFGTPIAANDKYFSSVTPGNAHGTDAVGNTDADIPVVAIRVKSKTYLLDDCGRMLDGLFYLTDVPVVKGGTGTLDDGYYYFSDDVWNDGEGTNGAMLTNAKQTIYDQYDDASYYYFSKKGKAFTNDIEQNAYYNNEGKRVQAIYDTYAEEVLEKATTIGGDASKTIAAGKKILVTSNGAVVSKRKVSNVEGYKTYFVGKAPTISEQKTFLKNGYTIHWENGDTTDSEATIKDEAAVKALNIDTVYYNYGIVAVVY